MATSNNDESPCKDTLDDLDDITDANIDDADFDAEEEQA